MAALEKKEESDMKKLRSYFESVWFIIVTFTLTLLAWFIREAWVPMLYYVLFTFLIIVSKAKRIHIVTLLLSALIIPRGGTFDENVWIIVPTVFGIFFLLLRDFFRRPPHWKDETVQAVLLLVLTGILSLVNVTKEFAHLSVAGIGQLAAFALVYIYFSSQNKENNDKVITQNIFAMSIVIAIEFAIYILTYEGTILGKDIDLGWSQSNGIARLALILIFFNMAGYIKNQLHSFYIIGAVANLVVILFTLSKGVYLAFAIIAIPLLVAAIYYAKDRKRLFIDLNIALFLIAVIVYSLFRIEKVAIGVVEYLESMNERGWFADEARMEIYQSGWNTFLVYPIFGAGAYSPPFNLTYEISHYHNFFIQVIATTGLTGLLSFIFFLYSLIKKSMRKQAYATMMVLLVIALLIYGLVDHTWFNPIVMILVLIGYSPLSHLRKPV